MCKERQFYQLIRYSYASSCDSFGGKPHSMWGNFPLIEQASRRLQKVVIENKDFEKLINSQDSEVSFFIAIRRTTRPRGITKTWVSRPPTTNGFATL